MEDKNEDYKQEIIDSEEDIISPDINLNNLLLNDVNNDIIPFDNKELYTKSNFEVQLLCGKGAYAKVVKSKCLKNNETIALKIIDKHFILKVTVIK
jgi:hypothetical protein